MTRKMKIIFSRKGFDTVYGGYPSPILQDGRMISLPIPSNEEIPIRYSKLEIDKKLTYYDIMKDLNPYIKSNNEWYKLTEKSECHLDPDIAAWRNWRRVSVAESW